MQLKYISPLNQEIYTKRYIIHNGKRLKTINIINLVDMFLSRYIMFNRDTMKLNSRILKWLYSSLYVDYIDYLIESDFIVLHKNYSVGRKSKTYKLTKTIKDNGYLSVNIELPIKLQNKIESINSNYDGITDVIKLKLIKDLYKTKLDYDGAKNWIDNNLEKDTRVSFINTSTCNKINNGDIYYSFDNYGRFHTNFTVLKKEIRSQFLKLDGEDVKELDITNSQPFFLYLFMKAKGFTNFNNFDNDVVSGKIYERLKEITGASRKEVKVNVYSVLFGRNMTKNYWNNIFNNLYPEVYEWICKYKKDNKNYKIIAHELQKIESDFMFKKLIPKIIETHNIPIITIHDSIIIQKKCYDDIKAIFINELIKLLD